MGWFGKGHTARKCQSQDLLKSVSSWLRFSVTYRKTWSDVGLVKSQTLGSCLRHGWRGPCLVSGLEKEAGLLSVSVGLPCSGF